MKLPGILASESGKAIIPDDGKAVPGSDSETDRMNVPSNVFLQESVCQSGVTQHHPRRRTGRRFIETESKFFFFKSLLSERKEFCAKRGHLPPGFWWCLLFCWSASGRKLLAATRAPLLPAAEPNRLRQSWEHLYSGHKGTMKRFLTAGLCQLAAAAGSSECKLRTSTINKDMSNRVRTCSTPVRVRASVP